MMVRSCCWGLLVALCLLATTQLQGADERPNFVFLIADDMGADDSLPFGNAAVKTPHLAKLAAAGLRCDQAFVTTSSCSPSRNSMITGRWPHMHGAPRLHEPLPVEQVTFIELLREAGYWTAIAGKTHLGAPTEKKFNEVRRGGGASGCEQFVATLRDRPRGQPFFLWLGAFDAHRDYQAGAIPQPHDPDTVSVPPYLPNTPDVRRDLALYYDEIARLDDYLGQVLDELDRQGVADNTVVVFLSDNGFPFPRGKTTLYDSGIRTPLIIRWPQKIRAGSVTRQLISTVDLAPTFLSLAGVEVPPTMPGKNLAPLFTEPDKEINTAIFAEKSWHDFDDHARAVRTSRWKYIRYSYTDIPLTPPGDAVRSATFQAMRSLRDAGQLTADQQRCFVTPRPAEELFDLTADPHELHNLATDPAHAATLEAHRAELDRWIVATDDRVPTQRQPDKYDREFGKPLQPR